MRFPTTIPGVCTHTAWRWPYGSDQGRKATHMTEGRDESPVPRADRHLLLADLDGALHQLFSITFARNGIFVNFPYHPDGPGAACRAPVEPTGAVAVNLDAVTSTTTHRVSTPITSMAAPAGCWS